MNAGRNVTRLAVAGVCLSLLAATCTRRDQEMPADQAKRDKIDAMYEEYRESFPNTPELTVSELLDLMADKKRAVIIVDHRAKREQNVSMIPGAIPAREFKKDLDKHRNDTIIVYCTAGLRSGRLAKDLRAKDLQAFNLVGGILSWTHAGQKVVDDQGETRRVHVYGARWDLLPEGYEGVW